MVSATRVRVLHVLLKRQPPLHARRALRGVPLPKRP